MKGLLWLGMILAPWACLFAGAPCTPLTSKSEKELLESYHTLRDRRESCHFQPEDYLGISKRAFLTEQYTVAIWSAKTGLGQSAKNSLVWLELNYFLGISYLKKDRLEEAIETLKEIVLAPDWQKKDADLVQKAHLALVDAYFQRAGKSDENVKYLVRLFKNRYAKSAYLYTLRNWNANK